MNYKAKIAGNGKYDISLNGKAIASGVTAKRVTFEEVTSHGLEGNVHHVSGPCIVTVSIPNIGEVEAVVI